MTTAAAEISIRDKIRALIDDMPERKLYALCELLDANADDEEDEEYWKPVIETDLTEEEHAAAAEARRLHREHPELCTPWEEFLKKLSAARGKDYTRFARPETNGGE
jgi:hypothetical protein